MKTGFDLIHFVHWVNKTKLVQRLLLFIKLYKCSLLTFFFRFTSNISYSIYISHLLNIQYKVFLIYNTRCFSSSKNNLQKLHRRFSVCTGGLDYMHLPVSINYEWALFLGLLGQICHIFFSKDSFKYCCNSYSFWFTILLSILKDNFPETALHILFIVVHCFFDNVLVTFYLKFCDIYI